MFKHCHYSCFPELPGIHKRGTLRGMSTQRSSIGLHKYFRFTSLFYIYMKNWLVVSVSCIRGYFPREIMHFLETPIVEVCPDLLSCSALTCINFLT